MFPQSISSQPDANSEWSGHEHVTPEAQREAQKLVNAVGSPELAKELIDQAAQSAETSNDAPGSREEFAKKLGFVSYLDLFETSTPVTGSDGSPWLLSQLPQGAWVVWNERDLSDSLRYPTREAALAGL